MPIRLSDPRCPGRHAAAVFVIMVSGCGGGLPQLAPAHALAPGQVEASSGVSGQIAVGSARESIDEARSLETIGSNPDLSETYLRGAFENALLAPGVAPWIAARVGLGDRNEGSLSYTGRSLRLGARHSLEWDALALSGGLGVASVLTRSRPDPLANLDGDGLSPDGFEWSAQGFAADLPLTFGWTARADVISAWIGARIGYEAVFGDFPFVAGAAEVDATADASRWLFGGLLGLSAGLSPVWVRAELGVDYSHGHASATLPWGDTGEESLKMSVRGLTLSPSAALAVQF
jgi:hypothetical protein